MDLAVKIPKRSYKGTIPHNRAVIGTDLLDLRERLNLDLGGILWMLAIQQSRHSQIVGKNQHLLVRSAPRAFLIRLLDELIERADRAWVMPVTLMNYPLPFPRAPSVDEFFDMCKAHGIPNGTAVIMLGLTSHSMDRWLRLKSQGKEIHLSPITERLMMMIYIEISMHGNEAIFDHLNRMRIEAEARGAKLYDILTGAASWYDIFSEEGKD